MIRQLLRRIGYGIVGPIPTSDELAALHEHTQFIAGQSLARDIRTQAGTISLTQAEARVFSQFGEDGIIQYLLAHLDITEDEERFVEFGVENYRESNTRFLLMHDNWSGLVMDGSQENIDTIKRDSISWRHDLTAVSVRIDAENINSLLTQHGMTGSIGLLSIDIDGNDYWVWNAIEVIRPIIVIAEYNSLFGPDAAVSIPYDPHFRRDRAHYSHLYWGCSLRALCKTADKKGYSLVGGNRNGNNAFFVRHDKLGSLRTTTCEQAFRKARFRESRDRSGKLSYLSYSEAQTLIRELPLVPV